MNSTFKGALKGVWGNCRGKGCLPIRSDKVVHIDTQRFRESLEGVEQWGAVTVLDSGEDM
jgi:hypothetical protein